ncbi:carboxymuconolactone decarboxylase family protein [Aquimarina sediminis]|uniref:carboxymuconolactone decarboxylase family protein n=1 Tax=Aquimarina sediminis TaxID=2070536 RepID=UPI000CA02349|nr:carboxymuconolactone decarboxylase family protein [Aquimarina sediminis]
MSQFKQIEIEEATGKTQELYTAIIKTFGGVPNLFKMLGDTPNILEAVLLLNSSTTSDGGLTSKDVEQIALTVSSINACNYCVATHVAVGSQFKIPEEELMNNIKGISDTPKMSAILNFTKEVVLNKGKADPNTVTNLKKNGIENSTILEILTVIGLYTFLNYLNHLTQPVLDFPEVKYQPITQ